MFKGLFINAAILITFLSIAGQCFRENELEPSASIKTRSLGGIIAGVLGSALMFFSVQISSTFMLDFRQLAIVIVAIYGGLYPAVLAGSMIGFARLAFFGVSLTSLIGFITALILSIACGLLSQRQITQIKKWLYMLVCCLVTSFIAIYLLLEQLHIVLKVFLPYGFGMFILTLVMYYYANYITVSNRLIRRLKEESARDFLTGLYNVRNFDVLFNNAITRAHEKQKDISILLIDIDFFKKVNDTYGHSSGDAVLKEIGNLISKNCRSFDIVSRNGGEEFSVILVDCPVNKAVEIGERIRLAVQAHKFAFCDGKETKVTVSIGVSTYPDTTRDIDNLLKQADNALYKAKNLGRNKVCVA